MLSIFKKCFNKNISQVFALFVAFFWFLIANCQTTVNFNFTGSVQQWVVPPCCYSINATVAGAKGGGSNGGNGALLSINNYPVTPGQVLYIYVGGMGTQGANSGGWNGGGTGHNSTGSASYRSWGGGGASDIRIGGTNLNNRVIVAGGGGGRSGGSSPVCGGAANCNNGAVGCSTFGAGGGGGTQNNGGGGGAPWAGTPPGGSAGTIGQGGQGGYWQTASGGGGGGGYYGGGGGGNDGCCTGANGGGGGGGGSSLVPPGGTCQGGQNTSHGYVSITYTAGNVASASNSGPYCSGETIELFASGGNSYSWSGPNGFNSALQNPIIPISSVINSGTYTVVVNSNGCVSQSTTTITVNPSPIVDAGPDISVCENNSVTLNATGASNYLWNNSISNGIPFTPNPGSYEYIVTGISGNCEDKDTVMISVFPNPIIEAGTNEVVCEGQAVTLNAVIALGGSPAVITWDNNVVNGVPFTPSISQVYNATAITNEGCSATDFLSVTVNLLPNVDAGPDQVVCEGTPVLLSGSGANSYTWNGGVNNGVTFVQAVGTQTYQVVGTDLNSCSNSDAVTVTVNPNPSPIIVGPSSYCANNPPLIQTSVPYSSYVWSSGEITNTVLGNQNNNPLTVTVTNNFNCSATSPPFSTNEVANISTSSTIDICQGQTANIHGVQQATSGIYSATFTSILGCDSVSNVTLNVLPLPNVDAGPDQDLCEGTSIALSANGAIAYSWSNGLVNGVPFTPQPGVQTYFVQGVGANSCSNIDSIQITVYNLPNIDAGQDQSICLGETVTLSALGGVSYVWSNNLPNNVPFTPTSSSTYSVTGTDNNGCSNTDQVAINVNLNPVISVNGSTNLCEGELAVLSGVGAQTYTWSDGIVNGVPFSPGGPGSYTYTLIGTDMNGCTNSLPVVINVTNSPIASFTSDNLSGCTPLPVNLQSTGDQGTNCVWTINNTSFQGCGPLNYTFDQPGCFDISLTITNASGCSSTASYNDYICADELPVASFSSNTNQISSYSSEVNFINTSQNAVAYVWDFGDGNGSSNLVDPSYEYAEFGNNFIVTLYAYSENGCLDSTQRTIEIAEETIYYVPNAFSPDGDMYNQTFKPILSSGIDPYNYSFQIFNRWGELIFESKNPEIGWDGSYGEQEAQTGTYVWKMQLKVPTNDERIELVGHLNLLR